jgi:hypothetical protein
LATDEVDPRHLWDENRLSQSELKSVNGTIALSIDHLIIGMRDLSEGIRWVEERLGVSPKLGGQHIGRGTHNALVGLGTGTYLEVLARDPTQPVPACGYPFDLSWDDPLLAGWALRVNDIEECVRRARQRGYDPGKVENFNRRAGDGRIVEWRVTPVPPKYGDGVIPFVIDWGETPHPSRSAPGGCTLRRIWAEHTQADGVRRATTALGFAFDVRTGTRERLHAEVARSDGMVVRL